MASKLDIINQALVLLGENPVTDLTSPSGIIADTVYTTTRNDLLSGHRWRFAVKKVALVAAAGSPVNEWTNHFTLPTDMLVLFRTYPNSQYEIFEDKLVTNNASVSVDYIFDPGEKKYPDYFVKSLATLLSSEMALAITNDKKMSEMQHSKAQMAISSAKNKDSQGRPATAIQSRPYIDVRG